MQAHKWVMKQPTPPEQIPSNSIIKILDESPAILQQYPTVQELIKRRAYLELPQTITLWDELGNDDCGFVQATKEIIDHFQTKQPILIYGDYDVDGMTSTTVLFQCFNHLVELDSQVSYFIPDRIKHGYGIDVDSVLQKCQPGSLIITVDCGTNDVDAINTLLEKGYKVIITDHHLPEVEVLPPVTIVNPKVKVSPDHKEYMMPGVYVAATLAMNILHTLDLLNLSLMDEEFGELNQDWVALCRYKIHCSILVAFGIVSDIIELNTLAINLLRFGLSLLNSPDCSRGIFALLKSCSAKEGQEYTSIFLAYSVIPKLNAAGRMGQIELAMKLLNNIHGDIDDALACAALLKQINLDRKKLENEIMERAKSDAVEMISKYPKGLILYNEHWYPGVLGIVASRLLDEYAIPIIVLSKEGDLLKGSGRSIPGINLHSIVGDCSDLIDGYGGHKVAIGVQLKEEQLEDFRERFNSLLENTSHEEYSIEIDAEVEIPLLYDVRFQMLLNNFEPYGNLNPELMFLLKNVNIVVIEEKGDITTVVVKDQNEFTLLTSKYKAPKEWKDLLYARVDLIITPVYNFYSGTTIMEFKIQQIKIAGETNVSS